MCVFLRLSISIRAYEHYEKCLNSRVISLSDIFKAKLGWLVGNIYSRIGTPDWVDEEGSKEDLKNKIDKLINQHCKWYPKEHIREVKKKLKNTDIEAVNSNDLKQIVADTKYISKADRNLDTVTELIFSLAKSKKLNEDLVARALLSNSITKQLF